MGLALLGDLDLIRAEPQAGFGRRQFDRVGAGAQFDLAVRVRSRII
jgi:hypothetical protein